MRIDARIDADRVRRAFRRAPRLMTDRVDRAVGRAAEELAREARSNAPKAQSILANSIKADKLAPMDYLVGPHVQHGVPVELGRQPGGRMPPVQSLLDWLKVKGVRGLDGGEPREAAWAIARKIQRAGTPAQPFMAPAREAMDDRVRALVAQGVRDGLRASGLA